MMLLKVILPPDYSYAESCRDGPRAVHMKYVANDSPKVWREIAGDRVADIPVDYR